MELPDLGAYDSQKVAAAVGSLIGAVFHALQIAAGGVPQSPAMFLRHFVEFFLALFAGFAAAIYLGPLVADIEVLGLSLSPESGAFAVGLAAYKLLPAVLDGLEGIIKRKGNSV